METVVESRPSSASGINTSGVVANPQAFKEIKSIIKSRIPSGIFELDRVLGGGSDSFQGIVPGSMVLVTGEPGIGKSTLLIQLASAVAKKFSKENRNVLYVSGEESPQQIKLRGERLGIKGDGVLMLSQTDVDVIVQTIKENSTKQNFSLIIIELLNLLIFPFSW